jgi:hypothetical protein
MRALKRTTGFALAVFAAAPAFAQQSLSFRDEFIGERLAPEFRVLNPDTNRMAMVDGEYVLLLTHVERKNIIVYNGQLPSDYYVNVRFASVPEYPFQGVALEMNEGDIRISSGFYYSEYDSETGFYFRKFIGAEESRIFVQMNSSDVKPFYIRKTKRGVEYDSDYSFDGASWSRIGTHVSVRPLLQPSFYAYISTGGTAPESGIRIDSFEIIDRSAP